MAKKTKTGKARAAKPKKKVQAKQQLTLLGNALRTLGGLGGGAMGSLVGQAGVGSQVGTSLGATISKWLGSGDYSVKSNTIVSSSLRSSNSIPMMHKENDSIIVRHKEFVTEVTGTTAFSVGRFFLLQPCDTNTFPWLSGIAAKFQQYRIRGMVFHYIPTSGTAVSGTNPALGSVMLQTSYRANDIGPSSKAEMLNEYWASEGSPAESFCHPIECSPAENPFSIHYTRTLPVPASEKLMYDMGVTYVATSGMPANGNVVGDLWVTYEIELSKPIVQSSTTVDVTTALMTGTNPIPGQWFPSVVYGVSPITLSWNAGTNTLSFPQGLTGTYALIVRIVAAANFTAIDLSGAPVVTNCSSLSPDSSASVYNRTVMTGATAVTGNGYYFTAVVLTQTALAASITFPAGTWTGTGTSSYLTLTQLA